MTLQKLSVTETLDEITELATLLEALVVQHNEMVDALSNGTGGLPLFGTAQTGGLLSPQQKTLILDYIAANPPGGGGGGARGVFEAYSKSIPNDGIASSRAALAAEFATYAGAFQTLHFDGTLLIDGTDFEIPSNVHLWAHGGKIKVDGVTLYVEGVIEAPVQELFELVNGGEVKFYSSSDTGGANRRGARVHSVPPEWFGARGSPQDGLDTVALQRAIDSLLRPYINGSPTLGRSWVAGRVELTPGAIYTYDKPLKILATTGFSMRGGGIQNTFLRWAGYTPEVSVTAVAGATLTLASAPPADASTGKMFAVVTSDVGTWIGHRGRITAVSGNDITLEYDPGLVHVAGLKVRIMYEAAIDHGGSHNTRLEGISFDTAGGGDNCVYQMFYYHRDSTETASGSTQLIVYDCEVGGDWVQSGWAIGSVKPGEKTWQEDLTKFFGCSVIGGYQSTYSALQNKWQFTAGVRLGTGIVSNNLNHFWSGITVVRCKYGVVFDNSNGTVDGGTIQSCYADLFFNYSVQGSAKVSNIRSEGSNRIVYSEGAYQSLSNKVIIDNYIVRGEELHRIAGTGRCELIHWTLGGQLELGLAVTAPKMLIADHAITAVGADTFTDNTLSMVANEYVGAAVTINNSGGPKRFLGYIKSNTATSFQVETPWATDDRNRRYTPIVGDVYNLVAVPKISQWDAQVIHYKLNGCIMPGTPERVIDLWGGTTWESDAWQEIAYDGFTWRQHTQQKSARYAKIVSLHDWGEQYDAYHAPNKLPFFAQWAEHHVMKVSGPLTIDITGPYFSAGNYLVPQPPGFTFDIEVEQINGGSHTLTFNTAEPMLWAGGSQPAPGAAGSIHLYRFRFTGTRWLARLADTF